MTKKILIVDDEPADLETMKTLLTKEGHQITAVDNGEKALAALTGNGFDLILLDIKMPALSGYDLLRMLREKIKHDAKIVYVSIIPEKEVNLTASDGFIQKPFSPESFLKIVNQTLGGK